MAPAFDFRDLVLAVDEEGAVERLKGMYAPKEGGVAVDEEQALLWLATEKIMK
jgi:hypothetical protein